MDELGDVDDEVKEELLYVVKADEILDLFNMLDCDGGGTLDIDEFCTGITRMATSRARAMSESASWSSSVPNKVPH